MAQEIATRPQTVTLENARIFYKNFAGREGQYNEEGQRNFGVALPDDVAEAMKLEGWNVKFLKPRDDGDEPQPWVPVTVSFKVRAPRVVLITNRYNRETKDFEPVRVTLPEDMVEMVDYADIEKVDLILSPYSYNFNGNSGIKAYLKSIFITIRQDELERKYASVEEVQLDGSPLQLEGAFEEPMQIEGAPDENIVDAEIVEE